MVSLKVLDYLLVMIIFGWLQTDDDILPKVPEGAQAVSLLREPLYPDKPYEGWAEKYAMAKQNYQADPSLENTIWLGRWTAYGGDFREAIRIFSNGILEFPGDARLYRHRGHRYVSIREFDRAINDFETALELRKGKEDQVEPDGQPNSRNIPVSTLHTMDGEKE